MSTFLILIQVDSPSIYQIKVKEKIPSLAELGGNQLYPPNPSIGAVERIHLVK